MHPGLIGCAPSMELLNEWNRRESKLVSGAPDSVPPLALLPEKLGALVGSLTSTDAERVAKEAARTVPPREHGSLTCMVIDSSETVNRVYRFRWQL